MTLPSLALDERLFDESRFPLVRLRPRAVKRGYAFAWSVQMRRLVALSTPFVLVAEHDEQETADDARLRAAWMRTHRATLAAFCRGLIVIEARATTRETLRAMTEGTGVRTVVVSSMRVAGELAPVLLKHAIPESASAARTRTQAI
ncbi:hypothetical protein BPUN_2243 [Candidatus Paraburkholderia kirkii]|nr:hypothetical protein BPUN_2243 [Candidatus Paraburkholderia kirkii]